MAICLKEKNRSVACGAKCRESTSSCDLFDSLVTAAETLPADELQPSANPSVVRRGMSSSPAAGLAWMYRGRAGSGHYRMISRNEQAQQADSQRSAASWCPAWPVNRIWRRTTVRFYSIRLATDRKPIGRLLAGFTSTTSATFTTTWPSLAAEAAEAAAGQRNIQQSHRPRIEQQEGGGIMRMDGSERNAGIGSNTGKST